MSAGSRARETGLCLRARVFDGVKSRIERSIARVADTAVRAAGFGRSPFLRYSTGINPCARRHVHRHVKNVPYTNRAAPIVAHNSLVRNVVEQRGEQRYVNNRPCVHRARTREREIRVINVVDSLADPIDGSFSFRLSLSLSFQRTGARVHSHRVNVSLLASAFPARTTFRDSLN